MLQGRMRQLQREFEASQRELVSSEAPADEVDLGTRALLGPLLFHQPITISAMVTDDPPSIDVKVAGIEFGGIAAWLDRVAARKRTLTFAVHFGDDETLVTANLDALPDIATRDLWLRTTAAPGEVVTALAYAVLQGRMAGAKGTAIGALEPEEFRSLLTNLSTIADLNRRIAWGRAQSTEDFRKVFNDLSPLLDKVPEWHELIYLVAQVAERTGDPQQAVTLYKRLHQLEKDQRRLDPTLRRTVNHKIRTLGGAAESAIDAREKAFIDAVQEYERTLGLGPPRPDVVFMRGPTKYQGSPAIWNEERKRYEVDPKAATDARLELEKYTVLMGRFMALHYGRCNDSIQLDDWNGFRYSIVEFLIATEPNTRYHALYQSTLLNVLNRIKQSSGDKAARRLALRLLDRYDCNWNAANLPDNFVAVGADVDVPEEVIRQAFAEAAEVRSQFVG